MYLILIAAAAVSADAEIVVTAARTPVSAALSGASIKVIDRATIDAIALPQASDLLRLSPGVAVSQVGPLGSQTQVRLRGAEANHTLVFIDGIAANDPASSGEFRFETLQSDGIERIEILRGPQSALWGSEAIGGVISVTTRLPGDRPVTFGQAEAGSFGTYRVNGGISIGEERAGLVALASHSSGDGIDAFGAGGERDGYRNTSLSLKGIFQPTPDGEIGLIVRHSDTDSQFDGFSPVSFARANTFDSTRIRGTAIRGYGDVATGAWRHKIEGQYVDSANINRNAGSFLNRSDGTRFRAGYQANVAFDAAGLSHGITGAAEHETQTFRADDSNFGGASDQRQSRDRESLIGEYRIGLGDGISAGTSVRRDWNDRFADRTTWRATAAARLPQGFRAHASYSEGVTDPTFTEQFGFFPGSFRGNPNLKPEQAIGFDIGAGWQNDRLSADITWFRTNLTSEIVSTFDSINFLSGVANATGKSRRNGVEIQLAARTTDWLRIEAAYTYLDASEQRLAAGLATRELRRPKHAGTLTAIAQWDRLQLTGSAAYVGHQRDTDFSTFLVVSQKPYTLLTLAARYRLNETFDLTARVENAGDASYRDVVGYATAGIAAYAGLRVRLGR